MGTETFTNYWIGQEPTGPGQSPTLDQMPPYVDVVPLAFVKIDADEQLDFTFLCQQNPPTVIQGWIKTVRQNGTKVTFSINSTTLGAISNPQSFAQSVKQSMAEWSVDGVDLDYEPSGLTYNQTLIDVVGELRQALGPDALITAPIYQPWLNVSGFLRDFAAELDFLTTMDYTPYQGFDATTRLFNQYAEAIGTPSQPAYDKVAIGMSCMGPTTSRNFTPLDDVEKLCRWEPQGGTKKGVMLYTFSYDIQTRHGSGTGRPDGTWTRTIHEQLP